MPNFKLTIEYSDEKPFYPYDHVHINKSHNSPVTIRALKDALEIGTDFKIVTPVNEQGLAISDIPALSHLTRKKCKRTLKVL